MQVFQSPYIIIELILILLAIGYQFFHSIKLIGEIKIFRNIFETTLKVKNGFIDRADLDKNLQDVYRCIRYVESEDNNDTSDPQNTNMVKLSLTDTSGDNEIILRIKNAINTYLINNYGASVNFSIIKDIIDREVDASDEEITQSIPTPLYVGLASTMVGIIFGLLSMPDINGTDFIDKINPLINGVKFAMIGSLSGLAWTTSLSSFVYKKAKKNISKEKNEQVNYLLANLLPELLKAEDTGISGLKTSLDRFSRDATTISDNLYKTAISTSNNIQAQQDTITKIENMNMTKVSKTNLELFERLEANMDAFNSFSEYLSYMEQISANLKDFSKRTIDINAISYEIRTTLRESKQLSIFLTTHLEKIENAGYEALKAVDFSDRYFKEAIEKLTESMKEKFDNLKAKADKEESTLKEIYSGINATISELTSEHLNSFKSAYLSAVPKFDQLDNLAILPVLKEQFESDANRIHNDSIENNLKLIDSFHQLNQSLSKINNDLSSKAILDKLVSIESKFDKVINRTPDSKRDIKEKPARKPGLLNRFRKIFTRKKKNVTSNENE